MANGYGVSSRGDERVLTLDSIDGGSNINSIGEYTKNY